MGLERVSAVGLNDEKMVGRALVRLFDWALHDVRQVFTVVDRVLPALLDPCINLFEFNIDDSGLDIVQTAVIAPDIGFRSVL